ncbi:S1 family peptidase [Clostridium botulinum]|uniref:S1 family peptidase n=1 Tax=Clostridium botulinum TaxID=1491 RepID=UPI000A542829|nr:S1 family peptidase [Clostridium botulinum]
MIIIEANIYNSYALDDFILYICRNEYKFFLSKLNVIGVGLGYKITRQITTCQKCITVFVSEKVPKNELSSNDSIPFSYNGIITDVVESGVIKTCSLTQKVRPAIPGYSISAAELNASGTLTCLVTDGKEKYILACNHTIAGENRFPIGEPIVQPGIDDKGRVPKDVIALLSKYIPIQFAGYIFTPENYVDCAIGKVIKNDIVSPNIAIIGKLKGVKNINIGDVVKKIGRTTECTENKILGVGITVKIKMDTGIALFKNQIATGLMTKPGDSGSIVVDKNNYAVGVVIAEGRKNTWITPMTSILKSLDVSIVI